MYGVITMSPNYEFMDYALSAFITTNIDIVEERLIIIIKEKNACVNLWSTIIDAMTIMIQLILIQTMLIFFVRMKNMRQCHNEIILT